MEVDLNVIKDSVLPFHRYRFFRDHSLGIYGLEASTNASNRFYHYFLREGDTFHYLGKHGYLTYNTVSKLYSTLEDPHAPIRSSSYKLTGGRFVCTEGLCCSTADSGCNPTASSESQKVVK